MLAPFDWRLFGFVAALTFTTGMLFGIAPALRATRFDLNSALKDGSRGSIGVRTRLSKALLVAQVAMSLVLLVGAGLFLNTLRNLRRVDVGFDTMNLMLFRVSPALSGYDKARTASLYDELQERLAALPGVRGFLVVSGFRLRGTLRRTARALATSVSRTSRRSG